MIKLPGHFTSEEHDGMTVLQYIEYALKANARQCFDPKLHYGERRDKSRFCTEGEGCKICPLIQKYAAWAIPKQYDLFDKPAKNS